MEWRIDVEEESEGGRGEGEIKGGGCLLEDSENVDSEVILEWKIVAGARIFRRINNICCKKNTLRLSFSQNKVKLYQSLILKGNVKKKWKGVYDKTWEYQALNNTL